MKKTGMKDTRWFDAQTMRLFKPKDPNTYAGLGDAGGEKRKWMQIMNVSLCPSINKLWTLNSFQYRGDENAIIWA
jgi:hypothetical protein